MNADTRGLKHKELTETIIGVFYEVYNELGHGFLESVYERAFDVALRAKGLEVLRQIDVPVWFCCKSRRSRRLVIAHRFIGGITSGLFYQAVRANGRLNETQRKLRFVSRPLRGLSIKLARTPTDEAVGYCHSVRFADEGNYFCSKAVPVWFRGQKVGDFVADILVNKCVLLELKAARTLDTAHEAQLLNYLRARKIEVGLLFNFGIKPEFRRLVFENSRKQVQHFGEISIAALLNSTE